MFGYYFNLALRSLGQYRTLTVLMVLAVAFGIGASMTTLTVFHVLSGNPLPGRSDKLFTLQLDPRPHDRVTTGDEPPDQLTRYDGETLLREKRGDRQALMTSGRVGVEADVADMEPFYADTRYTTADFFPMFQPPFLYGNGWDASADERHERVVVISRELNDTLFGGANSVGRDIRLEQDSFRIVGVLDHWRPTPRFYDLTIDNFGQMEQLFLPFSTSRDLDLFRGGNMDCFRERPTGVKDTDLNASCVWLQYWVELDTPAKVSAYRQYLDNYADQQHASGRFEVPGNVRLYDVMAWLDYNKVVPGDVRLQMWLAFGFLLVCLVNTVGLLLAKFLRRSGEIGVRRALGASRRQIFMQCLVEAGLVGLAGGVLGLVLAVLGLWVVRQQPANYAGLARLDPTMLLTTFVLAIAASLLAGLLPAWRAMQVTPAMQLKSQ